LCNVKCPDAGTLILFRSFPGLVHNSPQISDGKSAPGNAGVTRANPRRDSRQSLERHCQLLKGFLSVQILYYLAEMGRARPGLTSLRVETSAEAEIVRFFPLQHGSPKEPFLRGDSVALKREGFSGATQLLLKPNPNTKRRPTSFTI